MAAIGFGLVTFGALLIWSGMGRHNLGSVLRGASTGKDPTFGGSPWAGGTPPDPVPSSPTHPTQPPSNA